MSSLTHAWSPLSAAMFTDFNSDALRSECRVDFIFKTRIWLSCHRDWLLLTMRSLNFVSVCVYMVCLSIICLKVLQQQFNKSPFNCICFRHLLQVFDHQVLGSIMLRFHSWKIHVLNGFVLFVFFSLLHRICFFFSKLSSSALDSAFSKVRNKNKSTWLCYCDSTYRKKNLFINPNRDTNRWEQ